MAKTHLGGFIAGGEGVYELQVHNIGVGPTAGLVTVTDPLPTGLTLQSAEGAGWNCGTSTPTHVTCTRSDVLPSGASYPPLFITVEIGRNVVVPIHNVATVLVANDANPDNDNGQDTIPTLSRPAPAPVLSPGGILSALAFLLAVAAAQLRRARAGQRT